MAPFDPEMAVTDLLQARWRQLEEIFAGPAAADGFDDGQSLEISGASKRQLDYWRSTDIVRPSLVDLEDGGRRLLYSIRDVWTLRVLVFLNGAGVHLSVIRKVCRHLEGINDAHLCDVRLILDGSAVRVRGSDHVADHLRALQSGGIARVLSGEAVWEDIWNGIDSRTNPTPLRGYSIAVVVEALADWRLDPRQSQRFDQNHRAVALEAISRWLHYGGDNFDYWYRRSLGFRKLQMQISKENQRNRRAMPPKGKRNVPDREKWITGQTFRVNGVLRERIPPPLRFDVLNRDGHRCQSCGRDPVTHGVALELDHEIPVSHGGETSIENLVTMCAGCNRGKSDRYPTDIRRTRTAHQHLRAALRGAYPGIAELVHPAPLVST